MKPAGWIVRFDGTPTTGARIAAAVLLLCGFLGGFAARSRGEEKAPRPAAASADVQYRIAGDAPAAPAAAPRLRLSSVAALPGLRVAPQRRARRHRTVTATAVAEPTPTATPTPEATPEPEPVSAAPVPVAAPPAPAPAAPAPKPSRPAAPDVSFDSSG